VQFKKVGQMGGHFYYRKHIIVCERPCKEDPVLWILQNHESHFSILAINVAKENGIFLLTHLHHTSHKLQPMDCTDFRPYKASYIICINDWMLSKPGKQVTIYSVAGIIGKSFSKPFT
jgi:hypothetical protein